MSEKIRRLVLNEVASAMQEVSEKVRGIGPVYGGELAAGLEYIATALQSKAEQSSATTVNEVKAIVLQFPVIDWVKEILRVKTGIDLNQEDIYQHSFDRAQAVLPSVCPTRGESTDNGIHFLQAAISSRESVAKVFFSNDYQAKEWGGQESLAQVSGAVDQSGFKTQHQLASFRSKVRQSVSDSLEDLKVKLRGVTDGNPRKRIQTASKQLDNLSDLVDLLFFILQKQESTENNKDVMEILKRLFDQERSVDFYKHIKHFLSVFADVSQILLGAGCFKDRNKAQKDMLTYLQETLTEASQIVGSDVNLFDIHTKKWERSRETHPWLRPDIENGMIDPKKLHRLITLDISREVLANTLVLCNKHPLPLIVLATKKISPEPNGSISKKNTRLINSLYENLAILKLADKRVSRVEEKLEFLKTFALEHSHLAAFVSPPSSQREFTGYEVLIRSLNYGAIIRNPEIRRRFEVMLNIIREKALEENKGGMSEKHPNVLLARSLWDVLRDTDPNLDVPLEGSPYPTMRLAFAELAAEVLPEKVIQNGPYVKYPHGDKRPKGYDGHIIPPIEADLINWDPKDFSSCRIGIERPLLIEAAEATMKQMGYNKAIDWAVAEYKKHFKMSNFDIAWYPGGTAAIGDFADRLKQQNPDKDIVLRFTRQEYEEVINAFAKAGAKLGQACSLATEDGRLKTPDELARELASTMTDLNTIYVLPLSYHTRFGAAPFSDKSQNRDRRLTVNDFYRKVRQYAEVNGASPDNVICIEDYCQSFGRNSSDVASDADVILLSGNKAMGTGGSGAFAFRIRKQGGERVKHQIINTTRLQGVSGTRPAAVNFIASAIGLMYARSQFDFWRGRITDAVENTSGTEGRRQVIKLSMEQQNAQRQQHLTEYAVKSLNEAPIFPNDIIDSNTPHVKEILANKVTSFPPSQREQDNCGILTIQVPGISGISLERELRRKGYKDADAFSPTLKPSELKDKKKVGHTSVRIGLHYLHEEEDIDDLLIEIRHIQLNNIRQRYLKQLKLESGGAPPEEIPLITDYRLLHELAA